VNAKRIRLEDLKKSLPICKQLAKDDEARYSKELELFGEKFQGRSRSVDARAVFNSGSMDILDVEEWKELERYPGTNILVDPTKDNRFWWSHSPYRVATGLSILKLGFLHQEIRRVLSSSCDDVVDLISDYAPLGEVRVAASLDPSYASFYPVHIRFFFDLGKRVPRRLTMISKVAPHAITFNRHHPADAPGGDGFYYTCRRYELNIHEDLRNNFFRSDHEFCVDLMVARRCLIG